MPPPAPRSRTVSPSRSAASAVGLPQPSDARSASTGTPAFCFSSYRSAVIGSHDSVVVPQHAVDPQHAETTPSDTLKAACPYFSLTADLSVDSPTNTSKQELLICCGNKKGQAQHAWERDAARGFIEA